MSVPSIDFTLGTWVVLGSVLGASLAGSLHCVGMCGGLVLAAAPDRASQALYHLARLAGYLALGALAGGFGGAVLDAPWAGGLGWVFSILIAAGFFYMGVKAWRRETVHLPIPALPGALGRWHARRMGSALAGAREAKGVSWQAALVGLGSVLLPCGWLYAFVLAAATSGGAAEGAAVLLFFWLGTVPALAAAPALVRKLLSPLSSAAPRLAAILLIAAGVFTIGMRIPALAAGGLFERTRSAPASSAGPACH